MPSTLREIRNQIADFKGDRIALEATGGSTTSLIDSVELVQFTDTLIGSQVRINDGSNAGATVTVVANSHTSKSITFEPALDYPIVAGVTADMYNLNGSGLRIRQYDNAIKQIVGSRDYKNLQETTVTFEDFDCDDPYLEIPSHIIGVYDLEALLVLQGETTRYKIEPARYPNSNGWYVDTATRLMTVWGRSAVIAHESDLVMHGVQVRTLPTSDDDLIHLDFEWVTYSALATLSAFKGPTGDQWAAEALQKAAAREGFLMQRPRANIIYLPESSA